jgi:hypothetical protein
MPDALHCRLMQICLASYSGTPPKFADVAWTDIAAGTKATPCGDKFDFAFVGEIPNPRPGVAAAVVIAFRGTLEPARPHDPDPILTIRDWVNDADAAQVDFVEVPGAGPVHKGFHRSLMIMWPGIKAAVDKLIGPGEAKLLLITGHSKGGAIANLAAMLAHRTWNHAQIEVVTFAGARAGGLAFQSAYNQTVPSSVRYESWPDAVPELPPGPQGSKLLGWFAKKLAKSLGDANLDLIPDYYPVGRRVPATAGWGADVWGGIRKLLTGTMQTALTTVRDAHKIGPGTAYGALACPPQP